MTKDATATRLLLFHFPRKKQAFLCIVCICCFLGYDTRHVLVIVFLSLYLSAANILLITYLEIDQKRYNVQDQRPQSELH